MLPAILLSPLMLAGQPAHIVVPDRLYNHSTQTSTFEGKVSNLMKARFTSTHTTSGGSSGQSQTDPDSDQE
jgi:hypothetical protein